MDLIAKLPCVAAKIYRNLYREGSGIGAIDPNLDWSHNFTNMLGYTDPQFIELMRLYLTIHRRCCSGSLTCRRSWARTCQTRSCGISSGTRSTRAGTRLSPLALQVVPGYGHAVLRKTDPRYTCQREFALKHLPKDPLFKLVAQLYKIVPNVLLEQGKAKNPWPNVDAHSGVLLQYYGMKEMNYYTVLFGVSRALGVLSQLIWSRALGFPLERPKSMSTKGLMQLVGYKSG
ncbi:hypothetical protein IHE44_0010860 [Lamprotornis superbus]|uniref:Citrate synthase n=1 Tax=Lamprotornis superbus TaxID=245042 RepID=A0A835NEZ1_9PASS|nr:hypothetical protein IHE44_0010860 [Lamprotornis superbus]